MFLQRSASVVALMAAGGITSFAHAQVVATAPTVISPSSANVLNLLGPYLSLSGTTIGQTTLGLNLSQSIAVNNGASLALQQLGESDENLLGAVSNTLRTAPQGGTTATTFGIAANLGGGLPSQAAPAGSTVVPQQNVGGLGAVLGPLYVNGVASGTTGPLGATVTLLNNAYTNFTSRDLGVAKNYFADGGASNTGNTTSPAVAPPGYTLPTYNGLPNTTNSVYDLAYGVTNQQSGQDIYGSSRPVQVAPTKINSFDPTALSGLSTNPSFPSGHTTYAYTDSILLAMLVPQAYQSMLYRASAYANSRIVVGVHYPIDIIGSRALATYDLAQAFGNPLYVNNAATTGTAINLPANYNAALPQMQAYLAAQCGASVAACSGSVANLANDPYAPSTANAATYTGNLTYGLPTLSFTQAPREAAAAGGPDASILLAPLYGGSTGAALAIVPNGGLDGTLSSATINSILVNTETNALAAFYGTSLSYWTRLDLAAAAGYFGNVTGTLTLAPTDVVTTGVTIASGGTLDVGGSLAGATNVSSGGTLTGSGSVAAVSVAAGGTLAPGSLAAQSAMLGGATGVTGTVLTVNGPIGMAANSTLAIFATPSQTTSVTATGTATVGGATVSVQASGNATFVPYTSYRILTAAGGVTGTFGGVTSNLPFLVPSLSYDPNDVYLTLNRNNVAFAAAAGTSNEAAVAQALSNASNSPINATGGGILNAAYSQLSTAQARVTFDTLSGEGITAAQDSAHRQSSEFTSSIFDQTTFYGANPDGVNSITLTDGFAARALGNAPPIRELADVPAAPPVPVALPRTWRAWATGFGGSESVQGNAGVGTAAQTDTIYGGTVGVDYQLTPDILVGVAGGGSSGTFSIAGRATSGTTNGGHVAVYDLATFGSFYGASSVSGSFYSNKTTRMVTGFGGLANETDVGNFGSDEVRTRLEAGRHLAAYGGTITPFVALEIAELRSSGFSETNVSGPTVLGLNVQQQTSASVPSFAGLRYQGLADLGNGLVFVPSLQVAYVHDFAPQRNLTGALANLPGATFVVDGAQPAYNSVQIKAGGELRVGANTSLFATFDGEFSGVAQFYGGKGGLRFTF